MDGLNAIIRKRFERIKQAIEQMETFNSQKGGLQGLTRVIILYLINKRQKKSLGSNPLNGYGMAVWWGWDGVIQPDSAARSLDPLVS
ncbi:MAG: hypothetical protein N2450_07810 [bacterium]|nr:hypothetical protein [bacterium]